VTINGGPYGGLIHVDPDVGVSASTEFRVWTENWEDQEVSFPLSYRFFTQRSTMSPDMTIHSKSNVSDFDTTLPAGLAVLNNNITVGVHVYDSLDAKAVATTQATVSPLEADILLSKAKAGLYTKAGLRKDFQDELNDALLEFEDTGDVDVVFEQVAVYTAGLDIGTYIHVYSFRSMQFIAS
jgi:hypothetical protein